MKWMLGLSLIVAIAAFFIPLPFLIPMPWANSAKFIPAFQISGVLAICWVLLVVAGVSKFRTRGLWLLIGFPFAFAWPAWYMLAAAARRAGDCI
jgi:hypothetical protein